MILKMIQFSLILQYFKLIRTGVSGFRRVLETNYIYSFQTVMLISSTIDYQSSPGQGNQDIIQKTTKASFF